MILLVVVLMIMLVGYPSCGNGNVRGSRSSGGDGSVGGGGREGTPTSPLDKR